MIMAQPMAAPDVSFKAMEQRQRAVVECILPIRRSRRSAPDRGRQRLVNALNRGPLSISLKPPAERGISSERSSPGCAPTCCSWRCANLPLLGAGFAGGGRTGGSQFQFALLDQRLSELRTGRSGWRRS